MKKYYRYFIITLLVICGIFVGDILNNNVANAVNPCPDLACKPDFFGGFRCFDDGTAGYSCDDSDYPDCSETLC